MKKKFFSKFPETIYVTYHDEDSDPGYWLVWDTLADAAEDGESNESFVATYNLKYKEKLGIEKVPLKLT